MKSAVSEILLRQGTTVQAARVLLRMKTPLYRYPAYGVWCYLIRSDEGIVVFDPGPKYLTLFGGRGIQGRKTGNTGRILSALAEYFPGENVCYIAASHYHFDHTENAPDLQTALMRRQTSVPPIRLHDREYRDKVFFHAVPLSLSRIFMRAGYKKWHMGKPITDNEGIPGSGFRFILAPGHTSGNMALVNDAARIVVGGYWAAPRKNVSWVIRAVTRFADECPSEFASTNKIMREFAGYRVYTYHPVR